MGISERYNLRVLKSQDVGVTGLESENDRIMGRCNPMVESRNGEISEQSIEMTDLKDENAFQ